MLHYVAFDAPDLEKTFCCPHLCELITLKKSIMAKGSLNIPTTSSLGDYSAYRMKGVDKLVIRFKGGPTGDQIKTDPKFARVRSHQPEFAARGKISGLIMTAVNGVRHLADHSFGGMLNKVCGQIQALDKMNTYGERSIWLSQHGSLLEGINMNQQQTIESILQKMPVVTISRANFMATIVFPELYPGIHISNPFGLPLYRFIISFGMVPDMIYSGGATAPAKGFSNYHRSKVISEWQPYHEKLRPISYETILQQTFDFSDSSGFIVAVGIEFGKMISNSITEPLKKAGAAKILAVR
jgi:hypothetical protein